MKAGALRFTAVAVFAVFFCTLLPAATSSSKEDDDEPVPYEEGEFHPILSDIRRAEIIAFGTYPFVVLFSLGIYEVLRYFINGMEEAYLPWPFKNSSTAIAVTDEEYMMLFLASAGISVGIATVDFVLRKILKSVRERRAAEAAAREVHPIQVRPRIYSNEKSAFPQPALPQGF